MTAALVLATLSFACTSESTSTDSSASTAATDPEATFAISCDGELTKIENVNLDVQPKCAGGDSGTKCGGPPGATCAAQKVTFAYVAPEAKCPATDVYEWNGDACIAHSTHGEGGMLRCTGSDCESIFDSKDACDAFARVCKTE